MVIWRASAFFKTIEYSEFDSDDEELKFSKDPVGLLEVSRAVRVHLIRKYLVSYA